MKDVTVHQHESEASNHLHGVLLLCSIIARGLEGAEFGFRPKDWLYLFIFIIDN
jgi:hypothetical protein